MKRFSLLYAAPLLLLLAWIALPLARGSETLFLRDTWNAHLPMKWAEAEALHRGTIPLIDPWRAGGQPLAGNPNAVPFYPDNVLYLIASPIWALNAHFWLHLLLAPFAFAWMARSFGLRREAAWAGAVCYTLSGFFLSHLSFYNLIAGATLAPAFVAACLALDVRERQRSTLPAVALLWGLLLLGGDPLMALLALLLAAFALALRLRRPAGETVPAGVSRPAVLVPGLAALAAGTLLAAPQIVEFVRILPLSFRGHWGYTSAVATVASWDPRQAAEWLLPFLFGRPDLLGPGSFWGARFFTDVPPYYLSLHPGLLSLALIAAAGRPRWRDGGGPLPPTATAALWAWGGIAGGLFFALGRFNPLGSWLFSLPGGSSLRYPVKLWLPVAAGAALLCGLGFERLLAAPGAAHIAHAADAADAANTAPGRRFRRTLLGLALLLAAFWVYLTFLPGLALPWLRHLIPDRLPDVFVANERRRWAGLCLLSLALLAAHGGAARLCRFRPRTGGALLLALHALAQVFLLRPLFTTDAVVPYLVPPPALAYLPAGETVVHGSFTALFGPSEIDRGPFPEPRARWLERRAFFELYPMTGPIWRRRYELNVSPEGLDSFLTRMSQGAIKGSSDPQRVRLLAAWGVGRLLLERPLAPDATTPGTGAHAQLLARLPSFGGALYVYAIAGRAPDLYVATRVLEAPHLNAAYQLLADPRFQPGEDVVLPGSRPLARHPSGRIRGVANGLEGLEVDVEAAAGGHLVFQRSHLPLYRATVDGLPAVIEIANLQRMAVQFPPGRHRVRVWVDRRPLAMSLVVAAVGLFAVGLLGWWGGRGR
ncbi:MAG TPA: hypothetical protein VGR07_10890 [Thermoanaerobaculia bacterium]|jgi:hypothetical protein|nr:hypothetical protein [Thermoanaerobaculia bacterium]